MGIPIDEDDFGPDCPACFPLGQAPRVMWATFTGIKFGDDWQAGDGQCPNNTFKLIGGGGCGWVWTNGLDTVSYDTASGSAEIHFVRSFIATIFSNFGGQECIYFFANFIQSPVGAKFWGGLCSLSFVSPSIGPGIQRVMSGLNIPPGPKTFAEVIPVSSTVNTYRIARKKDGTNVNIKFDYS